MSNITVNKTDKRIRDAYQNVIQGRPSATDVILSTTSMRQAIETALNELTNKAEYEGIWVYDEKQDILIDIKQAHIAMNEFTLITDYLGGKRVESGQVLFAALGDISTPTERKELWERMEHIEFNEYRQ